MNVFFEESGNFKAGSVLSKQGEALQVELPGGRRAKVKGRDVLVEFAAPEPAELMRLAEQQSGEIDLDFLWEVADEAEFDVGSLAADYFGTPGAVQHAALALRLHGSPVYFRRKGRGRYQRAPEEQLKAALAALERRRQQALVQAEYETELKAGQLPPAFDGKVMALLVRPDKNSIEYKALEAAAGARGVTPAQLMIECGGLPSVQAWLEARFTAEHFPQGTGFPAVKLDFSPNGLPRVDADAFSIDDVTTTEIDDAFSVQPLSDGRVRIGIHIAAPALGIAPHDEIDRIARARLSTVYMPGDKITMLPESVVDAFTLKEGDYRPALSLYFIVNATTQEIVTSETCVEAVFVRTNIRHNELEDIVTEAALADGSGDYPHKAQIAVLWPFAQALHEKRQQARLASGLRRETQRQSDYNYYIEGEHVTIQPRRRGSPLDTIVAEMAILANSSWGGYLSENGVPAIYRAQRSFGPNRTRLQISPAPHEGLGVAQYAWSTSPLRRYVDLVNQWQLVALVEHGVTAKLVAPFKPKDAELYAVMQHFDETYTAYAEHQQRMERFWCLRWLEQEKGGVGGQVVATVVKGDLLRLEEIPLQFLLPGLGIHPRGTRVLLQVADIDLLNVTISTRLLHVIDTPDSAALAATEGVEEDEAGEAGEAAAQAEEADQSQGADEIVLAGDAAEAAQAVPGAAVEQAITGSIGAPSASLAAHEAQAAQAGEALSAQTDAALHEATPEPADEVAELPPVAASEDALGDGAPRAAGDRPLS
ncbi:ribonuclease catalytic domain-containing protein [Chitinasiproducens palmae]|uniref:Exoribonuclease-2 n=1 Tax=Chitinasiproducens palmae TaxID=1770053 RepID=A0A1H2PRP9_9BURK|nr:exoribonuclease-2 [Chitinasiproducens palmae]